MSGHLPADDWCRKWTAPIVILMVLSLVLAVVGGCEDPEAQARKAKARSESFWVTVAPYAGTGPTTFITREPATLPDGTQVVCVATFEHLWCRDAK